jgi:hypothetical protein
MRFMTLDANQKFFGTASEPGQLLKTTRDAADLWLEAQVIKQPVDPKPLIAFDVINEAAAIH